MKNILLFIVSLVLVAALPIVLLDQGPQNYKEDNLEAGQLIVNSNERPLKPLFQFSNKGKGSCTATVVYENYALTAAHCVKPKIVYEVWGTKETVRAVYINLQLDRAILKGEFKDRQAILVDHRADLLHSTPAVVYCGYAGGSHTEVCKQGMRYGLDVFQVMFSNTVMPGMSGGPVVDMVSGQLVGIITSAQKNGAMTCTSTVGMFDQAGIKLPD